ncbi:MAG: saccharopine dehydrogenase C-terminal domain-containing protein [Desulfococcaceae bacterium]|jgi:saccharopine dehydrogenase-like NADP-dependent oxidoreductase|nr:saccharopine dehydrogenase C-terminal domain-containing protein [Desulfococcaceae bacterium]
MKKNILVLGAGFVSGPLVRYLLELPEISLTVASRTLSKAQKRIGNHPRGRAAALDVENAEALRAAVSAADIVISLLPWVHHLSVARQCLDLGKDMVTTSYVKGEMEELAPEAEKKGLLFLNEIGVDPGIDHMAAMRVIDRVKQSGGEITRFYSYCGGLPAPESDNNPFGYKFCWSPAGVLLAARNAGRYLKEGKTVDIPAEKLFRHYWFVDVPGAGTFEAYVNRDALPYIRIYGIDSVQSIYRGTLRNIGHCDSWDAFKRLGLLEQEPLFDFRKKGPGAVIAEKIGSDGKNLIKDTAKFLHLPEHSVTLKKMEWLGLFSDAPLPLEKAPLFDMFARLLQEKLVYGEKESDMLIQHHEFRAQYPDGKTENIISTMTDKGIPGGDTSMSRTVGLPAAIAVKGMTEGKISLKGVQRPVMPEIYGPVLSELETQGIFLKEKIISGGN